MRDLFAPEGSQKTLRPHQTRAIDLLRSSLGQGSKRPVLQLPTGAGKTLTAAKIISMAREKGNKVAFCVPAISLIDQTVEAFYDEGIHDIGVIQAEHPLTDPSKPVQICSVQTLARREAPVVSMAIVDECHMQFKSVYRWMEEKPHVPFIGLSATPWTRGMGKFWDDLLTPTNMRELIDAGYLSDYAVYAPTHPDLTGVKVSAGDYQQDQLSEIMQDQKLIGDIVDSWLKLGNGDPTLCFAVDRAHARAIQGQFARAGIRFAYCDAYTDLIERKHLFRQLARREIAGIVNVGTLTTGVDADIRTLILARPTKSDSLFVQIIGRALRTAEGKGRAVIIDHTDTTLRLGMPCSISRDKLCSGDREERAERERQAKEEPKPKECPKCQHVKPAGAALCPMCGFEAVMVRDVEAGQGDLAEIKGAKPKFTMEDRQRWFSELLTIQRDRKKSKGWLAHTYKAKFGVWPRGLDYDRRQPSPEVLGFVKHRNIAYAKKMEREQAA